MEEFDELKAIGHIRSKIGPKVAALYDDDELLNVIDIIFDWYEDQGLLDIDGDDDAELDVDALMGHVKKTLGADKLSPIKPEHVQAIVEAELDYEQMLADSL